MADFARHLSFGDRATSPRLSLSHFTHADKHTHTQSHSSPSTHIKHTLRLDLEVSVALSFTLVSCQTMKTLRGSFYGVTRAFVWPRNICILHAPIMVLSDRCQTHQSCAFLCALSNGVYCTTRSSGSQCLHVCPWWEYNISDWFVAENTWLSQKTMCHDPFYFTVTDWFRMQNFLVWILQWN